MTVSARSRHFRQLSAELPVCRTKGPLDYIHDEYQALLRAYGEDLDLDELDEQDAQEDRS